MMLGVLNLALEGLVAAMLRPGLSQSLQFNVGGIAALATEVVLDGLHLLQIEGQHTLTADLH